MEGRDGSWILLLGSDPFFDLALMLCAVVNRSHCFSKLEIFTGCESLHLAGQWFEVVWVHLQLSLLF